MLHTLLSQPRTLAELAEALNAELVGDGGITVTAVAHPALASGPETMALALDAGSHKALAATAAGSAIIAPDAELDQSRFKGGLKAGRGRLAMAQLLNLFPRPPVTAPGIHPSAVIDPGATVAGGASVGPFVYVGPGAEIAAGAAAMAHATVGAGARVGADSLLFPGVRLGDHCIVGARCIIQSNAVIGGEGFGYVTPEPGSIESAKASGEITAQNTDIVRINSIGNVVIGDDVDVGANTTIDRGTLGPTRIGNGTKIDNQVQIAHNCTIGENCLIAGHVGMSGSVTVGNRVVFAGGAGVADHMTIGDDAIILAKSGVGRHVPAKEIWGGLPAAPRDAKEQELIAISRLPRAIRDLEQLKREVSRLKKGQ
jgi:UDP-3-O-[3-hydroxymyristoyl] glucosamine N-acyltransferase